MPAASERRRAEAVVLLSGGLDSYTAAAHGRATEGFDAVRADRPLRPAARRRDSRRRARVAAALGVARHVELDVDLVGVRRVVADWATAPVPKDRAIDEPEIPVDLRARAQHGVPLAGAGVGRGRSARRDIVIGVNALDYSGYPDCRPDVHRGLRAAGVAGHEGGRRRRAASASTRRSSQMTQGARSSARASALGLDYGLTHSCYDPSPHGRARAAAATAACCAPRASRRRARSRPADRTRCDRAPLLHGRRPARRSTPPSSTSTTVDGRLAVVLDRTAFYPTSGGQPFDTGALGDARGRRRRRSGRRRRSATSSSAPLDVGASRARRSRLGASLRPHAAAHRAAHPVGGLRPPAPTRAP